MNIQPADSEEAEEQMICPSCHTHNATYARYCVNCAVPLYSSVMLASLGQIQAQGLAFRDATTGKPGFIVVIGIWLIFFPVFIASGILLGVEFSAGFEWSIDRLLNFAVPLAFGLFSILMLYKTTANYRRRQLALKPEASQSTEPADKIS